VIDTNLKSWTRRDDLRVEWEAFTNTDAFKAGMEAMEGYTVPTLVLEPNQALAENSYRAGIGATLAMARRLHTLTQPESSGQDGDPGWGYAAEDGESGGE